MNKICFSYSLFLERIQKILKNVMKSPSFSAITDTLVNWSRLGNGLTAYNSITFSLKLIKIIASDSSFK